MLMVLSMALLVAPAMQHRLVECGNTSERLLRATTLYAGASLVPLAISLALATLTSHSPSPTSAASERGMVIWDSLPSSECPDFDLPNDRKGAQFPDRWVLSDADDASQTPPRPSYGRNNAGRGFFAGSDISPDLLLFAAHHLEANLQQGVPQQRIVTSAWQNWFGQSRRRCRSVR